MQGRTGSSEVGLWSGGGLMFGSKAGHPSLGFCSRQGRLKLEPPAFQFRAPK